MLENLSNQSKSPLSEVESDSLGELFARDPLGLSDRDIERICIELRAQRARWQQDEVKAKNKPKKAELSQAQLDSILDDLDLG